MQAGIYRRAVSCPLCNRLDFLLRYYKNDNNKRLYSCRRTQKPLKKKLERAAALGLTGTITAAAGVFSCKTEAAAAAFPEQPAGQRIQLSAAGQPEVFPFPEPTAGNRMHVSAALQADELPFSELRPGHTEHKTDGIHEKDGRRQPEETSWDGQVLLERWELDPEDFPGEEEEAEEITVPDELQIFFEASVREAVEKYAGYTPPRMDFSAYSPRADAIRAAAAERASLRLEQESLKLRDVIKRTASSLTTWTMPLVYAGLQGQDVEERIGAAARGEGWTAGWPGSGGLSSEGDTKAPASYAAEASGSGLPGSWPGETGLPSVRSYWESHGRESDEHNGFAGQAAPLAAGASGETELPAAYPAAYEDAAADGDVPEPGSAVPGLFDLTSLSSLYEKHPSFPLYSSLHSQAESAVQDQPLMPETGNGSGFGGEDPADADLAGKSIEKTDRAAERPEGSGLTGVDPSEVLPSDPVGQESLISRETGSETVPGDIPAVKPLEAGYLQYPPGGKVPACLAASSGIHAGRKQRRTVFVGDSRTVGMQMYVGGEDNEYWSAKNSMGYSWMADSGVPEVEGLIEEGTDVVILMGVNDLGNVGRYVDYMNRKAAEWRERGARTFFVSVTPVVDSKSPNAKNSRIEDFNSYAQANLRGVHYIDAYSRIRNSFGSPDGIHFDGSTYRAIYNIIHFYLYQGWYEEAGLRFYFDCGRSLTGWQYLDGEWQYMDGFGVRWIRKGRVGDVCLAPFPVTGLTE